MDAELSRDEVHRALVPLMRVDQRTNIAYIVREYALLIIVLAGCATVHNAWSDGRLSTLGFLPMAALGVALVATCQHRLSGLAHEASHSTLFKNKLANELASDLLLMFPLVAMTQKYRAAHLGHHQFVNDPNRDPDLLRLNHPKPHNFPISKGRFWLKYVVRNLWPPSILSYLFGRAKAANLGSGQRGPLRAVYRVRVARCLRGAYWLSVLTTVHLLRAWPLFWLFWVVPLLTVYPFLMQLREIAHHCNAPDDGDLTNSRVFYVHPLLAFCVFPYAQGFHLTHHLFAKVPHYRAAEAHAILLRYRPYREQVVVCRGYFFRTRGTGGPSVLDVLSRRSTRSDYRGPIGRLPSRNDRAEISHPH
ncbi:MAG: fatty acid desaturase [Isosphaeraceae bacterium]